MPNRLAARDLAVSPPARRQPGRLVPVGRRGAARARSDRGQADPAVGRLLGLSLVSRDGARVVRGRARPRADERALRQRQGRSRGDARRRSDLPAGAAAPGRAWRLAADDVPHARRRAVLRRHLFPAARRPRAARRSSGCCSRSPTRIATQPTGGRQRAPVPRRARGTSPRTGAAGRREAACSTPVERAAPKLSMRIDRREGGSRARPSSPTRRRWS